MNLLSSASWRRALYAALLVTGMALPSLSHGAIRTFVASDGKNTDDCSRTHPCRTFQAALAKADAGGEVLALDTAGFGPVTITKSITINGPNGVYAGVNANGNGDGVTLSLAPTDHVTLRGLFLNNFGGSGSGITNITKGTLTVENCIISSFADWGIFWNSPSRLYVHDTAIRNCGNTGIRVAGVGNETAMALLDHVNIEDTPNGVVVAQKASVAVRDSTAAGGSFGYTADPDNLNNNPCKLSLWNSLAMNNSIAGVSADFGATVEVVHSRIIFNTSGVMADHGATVQGDSASELSMNGTDGAFTSLTATEPHKINVPFSLVAGGISPNIPLPVADQPIFIVGVSSTNGDRGVGHVSVTHYTAGFVVWNGVNSVNAGGPPTLSGDYSSTAGFQMIKIDYSDPANGGVFIEVANADALQVHNTNSFTATGSLTLIW